MDAESFFQRWSRRKVEETPPAPEEVARTAPAIEPDKPPPTLEDVAQLTPDSDFKPFVARGVDENVRRSAMKKLFSDPQFNVMDGLDIYIDDYSKFEPLTPAMLAMMNHAQALLNPAGQLEKSFMQLLDPPEPDAEVQTQAPVQQQAAPDAKTDAGPDAADEKINTETLPDHSANDDAI